MKKKMRYCFLAMLSALALSACGASDKDAMSGKVPDSKNNTPKNTPTGIEGVENSGQDENAQSETAKIEILEGIFEYELIESEKTVLLKRYIGQEEHLTVYGSYEVDGKEYKTRLRDGTNAGYTRSPFRDRGSGLVSVTFTDGVKLNDCSSYFQECKNLKTVDLSGLDTSDCSDFSAMFKGCKSLQSVDLSTFDMKNVNKMESMFSSCESLTEIDLSMIDTGKVKDFSGLFEECKNLQKINLMGVNTENAESFLDMFSGCHSLTNIDVSGFDTGNVTTFSGMFALCRSIESLDLGNFDTSKANYMTCMFSGCASLKTLNISSFDTSQVGDMASMFAGCHALTQLDISHFAASSSLNYIDSMFRDCEQLTAVYVNQEFYDRAYSDEMKNNKRLFENSAVTDFTKK